MVAQGRRVKADEVHQRNHGIGGWLVQVVIRITRAIVTCRQDQQERINRPQAVDDSSQLRHLLNRRVHVVG